MSSTRDHLIDSTVRDMEAQVRSLENECRALRETLRDRFAIAALGALIARCDGEPGTGPADAFYTTAVSDAYYVAELMLIERKTELE